MALLAPLAIHLWRTADGAGRSMLTRRMTRLGLYLPVGGWGLLAYMVYQYTVFGDPLAFAKTQRHWGVMPELPLV